jgi:GntR family transcriptional regulator
MNSRCSKTRAKLGKRFHKRKLMDISTLKRQPSLASRVLELLMDKIRSGAYAPESMLPPENALAAEFKVSRATIRSAFDRLEARGLIVRRPGIGTFVRHISSISNPINQFVAFFDLIRQNGYEPSVTQLSAVIRAPSPEVMRSLLLEEGMPILQVEKIFLADGNPMIYVINFIPQWVFQDAISPEAAIQPGMTEPLLEFFEQKCGRPLAYYIASVKSELLRNCCAPRFFPKTDPLTPVLVINNIGFSHDDRPLLQSIEHHPGNQMDFKLIRSR